jgi:quinoprotein dehydrogenase-associated probable ABC transporter substrate-binding protein
MHVAGALLAVIIATTVLSPIGESAETANEASANEEVLRVCADPDNLPFSNRAGEGYENKIAEALALDLKRKVEYTWFPQRMGFVRNTLRKKDPTTQKFSCDLIIGVPKGYELTATTRPYMRSTYALLFQKREELAAVKAADDLAKLPPAKLKELRFGVFARSPGSDWLLRNGLLEQASMYAAQSGDPAENPAHIIGQDLAAGKIDVGIVWGPIAGYLIEHHAGKQEWRAVPFVPDPAIKFDYEISMGVRFGEKQWQNTVDAWIGSHQSQINTILTSYRVPLLDAGGAVMQTNLESGT